MPAGRKPTRTREEFVSAAIDFADAHGLSALTLKSLGDALGASTTAVYRYFRDKDALIVALRETLLIRVVAGLEGASTDPREQLVAAAMAFRAEARRHPCLSQIMGLPAVEGDNSAAVPELVVGALAALGLRGDDLARGYQQIESFVIGTSMFDFSDAPNHITGRHDRLSKVPDDGFRAALGTADAVDANNEAAFEATLHLIIDSLVSRASHR